MSKEEFVKALKDKGLNAGYSNDGIPTVFVGTVNDISQANGKVKEAIKELGYIESYGIALENKQN